MGVGLDDNAGTCIYHIGAIPLKCQDAMSLYSIAKARTELTKVLP